MVAAEIGQRRAIDDRAGARAELALQNCMGIRPGDGMHRVEAHFEAAGEEFADGVEVEQRLHQRAILRDGIDDFDRRAFQADLAQLVEIEVGGVGNPIGVDELRARINRVGDFFRRGPAIADVIFNAKVAVGPARIMARGQNDAAKGAQVADQRRHRRRREDAALADDDAPKAVGGGDFDDFLDGITIVKAPVAAQYERLAREAVQGVEGRLDEVLDIVRLLEDRHFLA